MSGIRWMSKTGLLIGVCCALGFAGPAHAGPKWLPINPADLKLKDNPASPGSDAMILYREETLNEQRDLRSEYYRIKIFTKKGKKWGNVEIPYDPNFENVQSIQARTILPSGTIVPFTGKVYDKVVVKAGGVKVQEKSFSLPDVQPGCIVEYMYDQLTDPGSYLNYEIWYLQGDLFVREAKFTFIPVSDLEETGHGYYGWRIFHPTGPERPQSQADGSYHLVVHNVPPLKTEPYMFPEEMIRSRVEFYYNDWGNVPVQKFWKMQDRKWNNQLESFISRKGALEQADAQLSLNGDTPIEKLEKIYARVQQIRNLTFAPSMSAQEEKQEKIVTNRTVEDVLKHGYGTWQDVNGLFVGLARAAGLDATLVYVAPRDQIMFNANAEDPYQLSDIIVEAQAGSQTVYLDPSAPQYPFGLLPWNENDVGGLLLNRHGGKLILVPAEGAGQAQLVRHLKLKLGADGSLAGTLEVDFTGQEAALWRQQDRNDDQTGRRKDLHDDIQGWLPTGATFQITKFANWDDTSKPLQVGGTVNFVAPGSRVYGRLVLPLSLYGSEVEDAFTAPQRTNVVYFHFPFQVRDDTSIQIPLGFQVESLPKVAGIPTGAIQYQVHADSQFGTLHITRELVENGIAYPPKYYSAIRSIFSMAKASDASDIVLESTATAPQK